MRHGRWALLGLLMVALLASATGIARSAAVFPDVIALPNGWLPEGIVTGRGPVIYSGSRANGAIYAADLRTGEGAILVPGQAGRVAVGLELRRAHATTSLSRAAAPARPMSMTPIPARWCRSTRSRPHATFVNDVIVTRDAAYFTDSLRPVYYRVPLGPGGRLAAPARSRPSR